MLLLISVTTSTALAQPEGGNGGDTVIIIEPQQQMPPQQMPPQQMPPQQPMPAGPGQLPPGAVWVSPPSAAPQNEDWRNVSHINGEPVPVGTRNEYLYRFRRTNLSINPVGWMMGFYSASLSHAVSDNVVIRGDASLFSHDNDTGFVELNASVPIYLRRAYQGPFVEPGVMMREWDDGDTTIGPEVLVGWHWSYDSGWNMSFALGGGRDLASDDDEHDSEFNDDNEAFFNGYFRVGYAF